MNTSTLLTLAQNAVDLGNIQAACEFYEVALVQSPNNDTVMEAYAEILIHYVGNVNRARQLLQHAIEVNPESGYVKYLNLAQLSEAETALSLYIKALDLLQQQRRICRKRKQRSALDETASTICCAIAELYLTDLCFAPDAETFCETYITRAIEFKPQAIEPHQLQASLRLSQQRNEEALVSLRRAVDCTHHLSEEHQPTYESKIELGRLLMQVSPDDAFAYLLEVLQLGDNNPYVWFLLGECARMRHRYVDAARLLRRARVMNVVSEGDTEALNEIDAAIAILVEEMGGAEAVSRLVDNIDTPDPIALLQPEEEEQEQQLQEEQEQEYEYEKELEEHEVIRKQNEGKKSKRNTLSKNGYDRDDNNANNNNNMSCKSNNNEHNIDKSITDEYDKELDDEPQWESCSDDDDNDDNGEDEYNNE